MQIPILQYTVPRAPRPPQNPKIAVKGKRVCRKKIRIPSFLRAYP